MKIYDETNKIRSHMTIFFSRIIVEICKLSQDKYCKSQFGASNMKKRKYKFFIRNKKRD